MIIAIPQKHARAIQRSVENLLVELATALYLSSDIEFHFDALKTAIAGVVDDTLASFAAAYNRPALQESATQRLPPEILSAVFGWLPVPGRIAASHVCRHWRAVLLHEAPASWSFVNSHELRPGGLAPLLLRSAAADLHLELWSTPAPGNAAEAVASLRGHLWRCAHLTLNTSAWTRADAPRLMHALYAPAARLRSFRLFDGGEVLAATNGPLRLFAGEAPALRRVKFYGNLRAVAAGAGAGAEAFGAVTRLLFANPESTTTRDVEHILRTFPRLKALAVDLNDWNDSADQAVAHRYGDRGGGAQLQHSSLRCLVLLAIPTHSPVPRFVSLVQPAVPKIHVQFVTGSEVGLVREMLRILGVDRDDDDNTDDDDGGPFTCASLLCSRSGDALDFAVWDPDPADAGWQDAPPRAPDARERVLWHVPRAFRPETPGFDAVTTLTLDDAALTLAFARGSLALLALERLTLVLEPERRGSDTESVFLLPRARDPFLLCPALRALRLRGTGCICIAPDVLCDFVECRLVYGAPRLDALVLCGVRVLQHVPHDLVRLLALAETFDVLPVAPAPVPWGVEDLMDWD